MARSRRVRWSITAGSTTKATTIKSAMDTALLGLALVRTPLASLKSGALVEGDYLFTLATAADTVYTTAVTQLQGLNAVSGWVRSHDCDHDASEKNTMGGCVDVAYTERGLV